MSSPLQICAVIVSDSLAQPLTKLLGPADCIPTFFKSTHQLLSFIEGGNHQVDGLILESQPDLTDFWSQLADRQIFFPTVVLYATVAETIAEIDIDPELVHPDSQVTAPETDTGIERASDLPVTYLPIHQVDQIVSALNQAIDRFLEVSGQNRTPLDQQPSEDKSQSLVERSIAPQQQTLSQKLRERLGYLGVYYKRNPELFFRNLSPEEKQEFTAKLKQDYQEIILDYFSKDSAYLNQLIDNFVNTAFFADISVSQIVETHMELIDEYSKQLRLEGRSEDILLDYRLTLIDIIAHLCEMYRRSIPRES